MLGLNLFTSAHKNTNLHKNSQFTDERKNVTTLRINNDIYDHIYKSQLKTGNEERRKEKCSSSIAGNLTERKRAVPCSSSSAAISRIALHLRDHVCTS